jgi:enterochelin esterase family protein
MGGSAVIPPKSAEPRRSGSDSPRGRVEETTFHSSLLNNDRKVAIYLPPGLRPDETYDLVIVLDEHVFNGPVKLPLILDDLIASRKLQPTVVAMVGNVQRERELSCSSTFSKMLAEQFIPWVKDRFKIRSGGRSTIAGSSLGGLAAACAGFQESSAFDRVIALSGSFRWRPEGDREPEWLTRQIAASPRLSVYFFVGVGSFETGTPREPANPSLLTAARHLRDVLQARGYRFTYHEFLGAHEPLSWSLIIGEALVASQAGPKGKE